MARSRSTPSGGEGNEVFAPPSGGTPYGGGGFGQWVRGANPLTLYGIVAGTVLLVGFGLYEVLHTPSATIPVPVATPAVGPTYVPAVGTGGTPPGGPGGGPASPPPVAPPPPPFPEAVKLPEWYGLHPVLPVLPPEKINAEMVERSIRRGTTYLKGKVDDANVAVGDGFRLGIACLDTYALLHAGESINDADLIPSSGLMGAALNRIKAQVPQAGEATYTYSLRAQALALGNRDADKAQLVKDQAWLQKAALEGTYTYHPIVANDAWGWDHSNSQYGMLGVWAASEAGVPASGKYWDDVERFWVSTQTADGGWAYGQPNGPASSSMTAAGVTTLSVAGEQTVLIAGGGAHRRGDPADKPPAEPKPRGGKAAPPGAPPGSEVVGGVTVTQFPAVTPDQVAKAIDRGLARLATDDLIMNTALDEGYTLYGVERAALATGFRFFGDHDWYRELGAKQIAEQKDSADGAWSGAYGAEVGTAFRLLFLARGLQPLLMNKLRFTGDWNDRPRDVAKLVTYTAGSLERPFAWGVADLNRDWWYWLDAPMIFLTTDAAPSFSDADVRKLRAYSDAGGFIFVHNEFATPEVDVFARDLAERVFPDYPLGKVLPTDLLYKTVVPLGRGPKPPPPLLEVTNGTRPLMVYSPTDLTRTWLGWKSKDSRSVVDLQMGLNLFVAAAGKTEFRNRLKTPYVDPSPVSPVGTVPVQQVTYAGGRCDPEPGVWTRFTRWFIDQTSIAADVRPTKIDAVSLKDGPVAVLTGNAAVDFGKMDVHALGEFVHAGGTLLVDSTGGNADFAKSVRTTLLPRAFPNSSPVDLPVNHPILLGVDACMTPLPKPRLRRFASEQFGIAHPPVVQYLTYGSGTVIVSDLDVTTGLLHCSAYGITGYTPDYSDGLYKNAILWTLSRFQPPPPPPATQPTVAGNPAKAG